MTEGRLSAGIVLPGASGSTSTSRTTARPFSPMPASLASKACLEAQEFRLPFRPLARLAQNEERGCAGREARSRGGLGKGR
jgi:hypothetical protein